jgi:hypothetical protein
MHTNSAKPVDSRARASPIRIDGLSVAQIVLMVVGMSQPVSNTVIQGSPGLTSSAGMWQSNLNFGWIALDLPNWLPGALVAMIVVCRWGVRSERLEVHRLIPALLAIASVAHCALLIATLIEQPGGRVIGPCIVLVAILLPMLGAYFGAFSGEASVAAPQRPTSEPTTT